MIDEIFDREYQAGREHFHGGIDRLVQRVGAAMGNTFAAIQRVQFDAPWKRKKPVGCA